MATQGLFFNKSPLMTKVSVFHTLLLLLLISGLSWANTALAGTPIAREGKGWLEKSGDLYILHVKGTPYEIGFQHGRLLKEACQENMRVILEEKMKSKDLEVFGFRFGPESLVASIIELQRKHLPAWYLEELQGLADGSGIPLEKVTRGNFIPELFHCSGFAIKDTATIDGTLYHGRVLDYPTDWELQKHALIVVAQPDEGIPWVNITFAGFIGCVTGMNAEQISLGEMGGGGLGHWDGVPMAVLMRQALQEATSLEEALAVFRDQPRTCQYFYVAADGEQNQAAGFEASWNRFQALYPGDSHPLLPRPVPDAVLLSAGSRYDTLVDRVKAGLGEINVTKALRLMDRGVAASGNLHNVLFAPRSGKFWVSYAGEDRTPAAERPYQAFDLHELLKAELPTQLATPQVSVPTQ
ncbi:Acyl-coenzyme A:6-aminopenicillanic acid acyl-transferase [Planctomycetales bacterium 10988]|nr:Acyl-coenzyme A:6-aminopenicillanic acid acyl-transferase [Planctomycetales bacterium 10988]